MLAALPVDERATQLGVMLREAWSEVPGWSELPAEIRTEFAGGELQHAPDDSRYDSVLSLWLANRYASTTNEYLLERMQELGVVVDQVTGTPASREACPCCGHRTLERRGEWNICVMCWWEDDGSDDDKGLTTASGCNAGLSLAEARVNFIRHGIFDPKREDLRDSQDPPRMYERDRTFVLDESGQAVEER